MHIYFVVDIVAEYLSVTMRQWMCCFEILLSGRLFWFCWIEYMKLLQMWRC